ncbi:hypothetical protein [Paenibacillus azoreducens]|uniref:Uncharacterized protein n=1 Tax=Paenibacillus azoreducens TaxID=116718 RepID=A0A920CSS6_9BACL|nr:hypothetical protein [Paenibacillus azoreducens]GIO49615.1 hypothetical protein J34TS1_43800 [Paenibacillus azoreducens]
MYRLRELVKSINKGVAAVERKKLLPNEPKQIIHEWSPNNFRRLIVGFDWAVIQHFVTSQRLRTLIERVDLRTVCKKDEELMDSESHKYKSILSSVISGRVLSSLEEIVFCTEEYPKRMLSSDTFLKDLIDGDTNYNTRFPRLRHISYCSCTVEKLWDLLERTRKPTELVLDAIKEEGIQIHHFIEPHIEDWWSGTSLRPQFYSMDSSILQEYFDRLKNEIVVAKRIERLEKMINKDDFEAIEKYSSTIILVIKWGFDLIDKGQQVFNEASVDCQTVWAQYLSFENVCQGVRYELIKSPEFIKVVMRIDFERIVKAMRSYGDDEDNVQVVQRFRDTVINHILKAEDDYELEINKESIAHSLLILQKLVGITFGQVVSVIYLSFIKYLTQNSVENAQYHFGRLKAHIPDLTYTRPMIEYWKDHLSDGVSKRAMDAIGANEVLVEQFDVRAKFIEAIKMLNGLSVAGDVIKDGFVGTTP